MSNSKKRIFIVGAVVAALIALYFAFSVYFMKHFYFGATINGISVGGLSAADAKEKVDTVLENYELVVIERDGTEDSIHGEDIALSIDWGNQLEEDIEKQNGFAWGIKLLSSDSLDKTLALSYDEKLLSKEIENLSCCEEEKQVKPQNASIVYKNDGFEIEEEQLGTAVNVKKLNLNITKCIENIVSELILEENGCYYEPTVTADNESLNAAKEQMNQMLNAVITYEIGDNTEVLDKDTFAEWLYVNDDFKVFVDEEAVDSYVKSLGSKYNTSYRAKNLMTSYGVEVTISNSHYGWRIDNATEKAAIVDEIMAGEKVTRDLHYAMTANSHEGNDYGNSYVEINLAAQHLFMYVDGKLIVESDFVSGNVSKNYNTPTGAFTLTYKDKDAVLRGEDYTTPVSFWMPYFGNVGMHDATWRKEFGGEIYKTNGSHGCVNLPWSKAKVIFENIEEGFPVLCYELSIAEPEPEVIDPVTGELIIDETAQQVTDTTIVNPATGF